MKNFFLTSMLLMSSLLGAKGEVDPNFYVYLCFGQSNMEGNAAPESVDYENISPRFQMLACVDFQNPARTMGQWYTATPPIVRQGTGLGMADYFGRTMVKNLPDNVKVGVIDVAIGGTKIEGFMEDEVDAYIASMDPTTEGWLINYFKAYDNHPYKRLVDMAKIAQKTGVIKGILLHQGESNNCQTDWPQKVKTIYDRLISDLGLNAADIPLFVGETVRTEQGGYCGGHNGVIVNVPAIIDNSYVISSEGCAQKGDGLHFTAKSYRMMGARYAKQALKVLGIEAEIGDDDVPEPVILEGDLTIDKRFESLEEIGQTTFAIVNEAEGKAFYVEGRANEAQILDYNTYDKSLTASNLAVHFRLENGPSANTYLLRCIKMNGDGYNFWGSDAYLNSGNFSCFVLGLNNQYGQDIANGAVWQIKYDATKKGFALKNVGAGGYLKDTGKAEYTTPTYFTLCTLKSATSGIREVKSEEGLARRPEGESQFATANWFTLDGRNLNGQPTQHGIYIVNGKKIIR